MQIVHSPEQEQGDESKDGQDPQVGAIVGLNGHKADRTGQDSSKVVLVAHERKAGPGADEPEGDRHDDHEEQWVIHGTPRQKIGRGEKQASGYTGQLSFQRYVLIDHPRPLQWQHEDQEQQAQPLGCTPGEPAVSKSGADNKGNVR